MTKAQLLKNVIGVALGLGMLVLLAALAKFQLIGDSATSDRIYALADDFSSVVIAIAAAYLAYCFQKRSDFLTALRELWHSLVKAKNGLIAYTHDSAPTQAAFGAAHGGLSEVIDGMRGVYRNVNETDKKIGFFPYEPLHDMRKTLEALGFLNLTPDQQKAARRQIVNSWYALRATFLREFSTPYPSYSITTIGAADPRRLELDEERETPEMR